MSVQSLKEKYLTLKKEAGAAHDKWCRLNADMITAEREWRNAFQKVCTHPRTRIVDKDWFEPPMREKAQWKEKVCIDCGKVLAQSSTKEVWTEMK